MSDPMDVVRAFYRAMNAGDADRMAALYAPTCILERVSGEDAKITEGREAARQWWAAEFARSTGALAGGGRVRVERIAGIETGWGWVRADWVAAVRDRATGAEETSAGYSYFWVEGGLIRRQKDGKKKPGFFSASNAPEKKPGFFFPLVGVGAVILLEGQVVLVKRRNEPLAGQWSLPGGALELGETLEAGVAREVLEETGLVVEVGPLVDVFDRILVSEPAEVGSHFVLVDYLCRPLGGTLTAGGDVEAVTLADPAALERYRVTDKVRDVVAKALALADSRWGSAAVRSALPEV
jgi:ADP-ribose pyrophosphatase YjhB (NUDIX family)